MNRIEEYCLSPKKEFHQITYFILMIEDLMYHQIEGLGFYVLENTFKLKDRSVTFDELKKRALQLGIIKNEPKWFPIKK